jgi:hypothetical protein
MNLAHPKNLETLRGEYDKLGMRIARLGFIRATLFVLFVFSLASAFQTISSNNASRIVDRIKELTKITNESPPLDNFLTAIYFQRTAAQTEESVANSTAAQNSEIEPKPPPSPDQVEEAKKEQADLGVKLTNIANEAFTLSFKAPLLGTEIKLDLRIWGFILLFCFIFWEVHLFVLRYKLRTLLRIASVLVERAPEESTVLDQLLFRWNGHRPAAFSRHPAQFELVASLVGGLALIVYLCEEGRGFWGGTDPTARHQLIELYGFFVVYAISYGAYVKRQINAEALAIDGFETVISYLGPVSAFVGSRLRAFSRRLWPEVNLATGSVMVIGTLLLLVGAPFGCEERTGLHYLQHPDGWLVGPVCGFGAGFDMFASKAKADWHNADWHNLLIATLYGLALAIASFTLLMLLVSLVRRKRLGPGVIPLYLAIATTVLALFFLTELAIGQLLDFLPYGLLLWLVPMWTWWRYTCWKRGARRADWPRVQRSLFYWYAPQVGVATIVSVGTLFEQHRLVGVPVFVCGLGILALGYWRSRALVGPVGAIPQNA